MIKKILNGSIGIIVLIIIWQAIVTLGDYKETLLPPPLKVAESIIGMLIDGTFFIHLQISMFRFLSGYLSAVIVAIILGLILGSLPKLWSMIDPIIQVLRPVSPIAWSPFIVLWFGIGNAPAIVIIFIAAFFPVLLTTVSAVRKVNPIYLKLAQNFEMKRLDVLTKVVFPACFPQIANSLHIAIGTAWIFLVAGEMVGTQSGLGFLIVDARNALRLDLVLAGIIYIGLCGLLLDKTIKLFESWVEKQWGVPQK